MLEFHIKSIKFKSKFNLIRAIIVGRYDLMSLS